MQKACVSGAGGWESSLVGFASAITFDPTSATQAVRGWYANFDFINEELNETTLPTYCNWTGVTCENGTIIGLDLSGQGVQGEVHKLACILQLYSVQFQEMYCIQLSCSQCWHSC